VRTLVIEALGTINDVQAIEALINCWSDNDHEVRVTAAKIVSEMGPVAIDPLIAKTLSEDSYFRWRAAKALRAFQNTKSVSAVIALLNDDTSEVKWMAIDTLERLGDAMAIAPLSLLLNDADSGIKNKAYKALNRIRIVAR
jgi:HEAT repeat protein